MVTEPAAAKKAKVHTIYKLKDGTRVPGVTTVLGVLNKPALVYWANDLGLNGIAVRRYVDALAEIGTIAHGMILAHHENVKFDTVPFERGQIDKAENCLLSYFEWAKKHTIEVILAEKALVSEQHRFGGTFDLYCKLDGVLTLLDYKTGKALYPENVYQCAAYRKLLLEHGYATDQVRILRVGRDETEGFDEKNVADTKKEWQIFEHALALYRLGVGKMAA